MRIARPRADHRKLVESDTEMPVGDSANQRRGDRARLRAGIDNDEVVAQPVHFHEGKPVVLAATHAAHIAPRRVRIQSDTAISQDWDLTAGGQLSTYAA